MSKYENLLKIEIVKLEERCEQQEKQIEFLKAQLAKSENNRKEYFDMPQFNTANTKYSPGIWDIPFNDEN